MSIPIESLMVSPSHVQRRLFGAQNLRLGREPRARRIAGVLYCAMWARAAARATSIEEVPTLLAAGIAALRRGEVGFDLPGEEAGQAALERSLLRENANFRSDLITAIDQLQLLSAVKLRVAFWFTVTSDVDRLRLARIMPGFAAIDELQLSKITISNQLAGLHHPVSPQTTTIAGSVTDDRVELQNVGDNLGVYVSAKTFDGGDTSDIPRRVPGVILRDTATVQIKHLETFDNLVLFHFPMQRSRTKQGRKLLQTLGVEPQQDAGLYSIPLNEIDVLQYSKLRLPDTTHARTEWINHDVSLRPPVVNHSYNDRTARTAEGIRLLG
jgi:hypothetical protein